MRAWTLAVLVPAAAACDTGLRYASVVIDSGPADASAACLAANDHSDYEFIQEEIFGVGVSGQYKSCSFGSCHDRTPPTDAALNLTPCPDGTATCDPAGYDPMLSWMRLVGVEAVQHPDYKLGEGMGGAITTADVSGVKEATLTGGTFDASWVDKSLVLARSQYSGNRGTFKIVAADASFLKWRSQSARDEGAYMGTWKVVESGAGDDLAVSGNDVTLTDAGADFPAARVGNSITIKGATTSGNNGTFPITDVPDATHIVFTNTNATKQSEAFTGTWRLGRKMTRVVPSDPANSYLLIKLGRGDRELLFGDLMPQSSSDNATLCDEKVDAVERWIMAGALGPGSVAPPADAAPADSLTNPSP